MSRDHGPRALALALAALTLVSVSPAAAQTLAPQMPHLPPGPLARTPGSPLTVYPVRDGVYMVTGAGANVAVSVGADGVLVVDPGAQVSVAALMTEVRRLSDKPVRFILNTNADPDHIGANQAVAASGETLQGGNTRPSVVTGTGGAPIWAHEGVLAKLSAGGGEPVGWPSDTYFVAQKDMFVNGEAVQIYSVPAGHSGGDSLVMFRRADVIVAGDVYTPDRFPVIAEGGSINGLIAGLNHLLRLTVPEFNQEGGTFVIPGHGRLSDEADVADYRDMVTIVRDRVRDMIARKMTLAQVKAAGATLDYDVRFGADQGAVFVEQVYRSLSQPAKGRQP
jgi:glyoxylase-like metal-dependent hydrolase (beta-lactamase superfamily II)